MLHAHKTAQDAAFALASGTKPCADESARFEQWASLFSGQLFVNLVAYVDESGRHDRTGKRQGSGQIVVAGWLDWRDNWAVFCREWKTVLDNYGAPYFHFWDWADASAVVRNIHPPTSAFAKNPYRGWSLSKLDCFLYSLADIAGSGKRIILGGFISTRDFNEAKKHPDYSPFVPKHGDPYMECLVQFFDSFPTMVQSEWPSWTEKVSFFFDQNKDSDWNHAVQDSFMLAKKKDSRMAELTFADMRVNLPLQAADMLAYRLHQIVGKFVDPSTEPVTSKLDDLLLKRAMLRAIESDLPGAMTDYFSLFPLRFGKYPWRK